MQTLNKKYIIKINDEKINNYLDARNLKFNRDKMINKKKFPLLSIILGGLKTKEIFSFMRQTKMIRFIFGIRFLLIKINLL